METWREFLNLGQVIPACPLSLNSDGQWSERHQRAILRYYVEAGAGGVAVGVHSTQFEIRAPEVGLFRPVLELAAETFDREIDDTRKFIRIAGVIGQRAQAMKEAQLAADLHYHAVLLGLNALTESSEAQLLEHCRSIASVIPIVGFYLQPAVGGRVLSYSFWRSLCDIDQLVAIKIAPFNRYATLDVVRAVIDAERHDVALYTGNDDNIILDLLTPFSFGGQTRYIVGGLLGQWAVWTKRAVELLDEIKVARENSQIDMNWLRRNTELTDANAAIFDAANNFSGCISGINEVLSRQGLSPSNRCLSRSESLSKGQADEIDRVIGAYPNLMDDEFVQENRSRWLED